MALNSERPPHQVRITRPFDCGISSVTVDQFGFFIRGTAYRAVADKSAISVSDWEYDSRNKHEPFSGGYTWQSPGFKQNGDHPLLNVSWNDAVAFCEWLSKQERKTYAPTDGG